MSKWGKDRQFYSRFDLDELMRKEAMGESIPMIIILEKLYARLVYLETRTK